MSDRLGGERRKLPRDDTDVKFKCFVSGRRFVAGAVNMGPGGAFIRTDRVVRPGSIIIMELVQTGYAESIPHLVGRIAHFAISPEMGAGVKWVKAIAPGGLSQLRQYLTEVLEIEVPRSEVSRLPVAAEEHPVSYDFASQALNMEKRREPRERSEKIVSMFGIKVKEATMDRLGIGDVRVVHSEAPKQKRATIGDGVSMRSRDEGDIDPLDAAKELEEWMRLKRVGKKVDAEVLMVFEGKNIEGNALSMSANTIWIQSQNEPPDAGKRLLIQFPIELAKKVIRVIIVAEVQKRLINRSRDGWGLSVKVITVNEGDDIGAFNRFLTNL